MSLSGKTKLLKSSLRFSSRLSVKRYLLSVTLWQIVMLNEFLFASQVETFNDTSDPRFLHFYSTLKNGPLSVFLYFHVSQFKPTNFTFAKCTDDSIGTADIFDVRNNKLCNKDCGAHILPFVMHISNKSAKGNKCLNMKYKIISIIIKLGLSIISHTRRKAGYFSTSQKINHYISHLLHLLLSLFRLNLFLVKKL